MSTDFFSFLSGNASGERTLRRLFAMVICSGREEMEEEEEEKEKEEEGMGERRSARPPFC